MTDSVLVRVARGDPGAVAACIDEFGALVWSLARRLSPTPSDAEDAVQEIYLDVWRSAARYQAAQGSEKVFIMMIARRRLIDRLRRNAQRPEFGSLDELETVGFAAPGTGGEISAEAERAAMAVSQLRPEEQRLLELAVVHGLSHGEIAERTRLPLGTVKTQIRRGLIRVREILNLVPEPVGGGA